MKKLINDPENVVREELSGIARAHGDLVEVHIDPHYRVRKDSPVQGKFALVSGGGSGHEPMHGGFVGMGMLDAACPGEVFTSPTPDQMEAATKAVDGGAGVLHIVKNYTGDVMNFQLAAEMAADEVAELCRKVNANARSMGMALTSCTVPAAGKPTFELGDDEMELGIGIHGEPGRKRLPLAPANEVAQLLAKAGITVARSLVGNYITSLEMAGCSVTLVKTDDGLVRLWDAPVNTPGLRWGS